jgi:hypothetical protein
MLPGLVDHLWQSAWICGVITLLAFLSAYDFAPLRLWMWRIAALKFALPFAMLVAIGEWHGLPVKYPTIRHPRLCLKHPVRWPASVSPAQLHGWSSWRLLPATLAAVLLTVSCARWILRQLQYERERALEENRRLERDPDDIVRRPGFFSSALLTACAMLCVAMPALAGALEDRQRHFELLVINSARCCATPRDHDAGRARNGHSVSRRRRSRRRFHPQCDHPGAGRHRLRRDSLLRARRSLLRRGAQDWFIVPRYDVRVTGRVIDPERFDPLALRARMTRMLAERHGIEIYVDSKCQPPCGKYGWPCRPTHCEKENLMNGRNMQRTMLELMLLCLMGGAVFAGTPSPARVQFDGFLAAFNSGDRATITAFGKDHAPPDFLRPAIVDQTLEMSRTSGGYDVLEVYEIGLVVGEELGSGAGHQERGRAHDRRRSRQPRTHHGDHAE